MLNQFTILQKPIQYQHSNRLQSPKNSLSKINQSKQKSKNQLIKSKSKNQLIKSKSDNKQILTFRIIRIQLTQQMNKTSFDCPGCGKSVSQFGIKNHITNCIKYQNSAFFYTRAIKFSDSDKINELKFLAEELAAAKQHIDQILAKKSHAPEMEQDDFDFLEQQPKSNGNIPNKPYQSQFLQPLQKLNLKKASQSFHEPQPKFNPMDQKYKKANSNKMQEQPKINHGMKMQEQANYGRKKQQEKHKSGMKPMEDEGRQWMGGMDKKPKGGMRNDDQEDQIVQMESPDIAKCPLCKQKFWTSFNIDKLEMMEECWRFVCKRCFKKYIETEFVAANGFPKCPYSDCTFTIPQHQSRAYLGDRFEHMQDKILKKSYNFDFVECNKCKSQYDFSRGNPNDAPKKDETGKPIKPQHAILYAEQRFMCPRPDCKTEQCKQCKASPYHLGMSCTQAKDRALMLKCRYCNEPITDKNIKRNGPAALQDICNSPDCQSFAKDACTKVLGCGHPCSGVKNQAKCLPCLRQGCCEKEPSLAGQSGDDFCAICFTEGLGASPSIQCGCGHIFHFKCIQKRFQIKWLTPRILFNFCLCPLCKKWIEVPPENELYKTITELKQLHELIEKMSFERLKFQELEKDEKIVNKDSRYFNKPRQYAMAIYAYFMCFKCKKPYFGGRKNCAQVMNADQNRQKEGFDEKELVCPKCCDIPIENCPKHGVDFIQFKCKFCCSTAQWFCWGNTHFCEPCHKKQCNGEYVSKYTREQLPKCEGPGKCPIGGNHGLNGDQKMLGCAICRNYKENSKNF